MNSCRICGADSGPYLYCKDCDNHRQDLASFEQGMDEYLAKCEAEDNWTEQQESH